MARPRSDIPERIVLAAREHFLRHGVDGSSLRAIAKDAGTNIGMVYYYYPTKDELFLAVVESVYGKLTEDMGKAVAPGVAVEERLRRLFQRLAALSDEEFMVVRIIVREALTSSVRLKRLVVERFLTGHIPLMATLLADGIAQGRITERHHPMVIGLATLALGLLPQVVLRRLPRDAMPFLEPPKPAEAADALTEVLLHGISAEPRS